ncbi:hypothetical protein HS1_000967 [Candidatus Desulfofervidus auxilii]|uniref:Uncharacterized protein n=1 Tax=Desulfofervidus auxilii TaxID=1621989 RepID=A0A7U4TI00_DESA2|nr:hypothetical protein [Candidatus Desulfofervidus auxilii]AMM40771.1 hypothetical protein HS1_000967 [Candidatus Desulfofervidus auxilii]
MRKLRNRGAVHIISLLITFFCIVGIYTTYKWYKQKTLWENSVVMFNEISNEVRDILVEQGMDPAAYDMAVGNILAAARGNVKLLEALQDYLVLIEKANSQGVKR